MDINDAALALKELGHTHRLQIFKHLVKSGYSGLPVGKLRDKLEIPHSSMTHHIGSLVRAGLIIQKREGRILRCIPQYKKLWELIDLLQEECCIDQESNINDE